ncbi:MAG: alpha/beta hydrolase [Dokdonella sp.]
MRLLYVLLGLLVCTASLPARAAPANAAVSEIGQLDGVAYRIDIPANWKRGLVVYFHGYAVEPVTFHKGDELSPMFAPILASGFAVIQSAYSATGWAVEEGSTDTEKLRRYFIGKHGEPEETYVMGISMGGTLTAMTIEMKPEIYDGALSLCGTIEPTDRFMQRDFALRAAFDYYFPDLLGPLVPIPSDYAPTDTVVRKIAAAMRANVPATASLRAMYGVGDVDSLPGVIAAISYDIKEMQQRLHDNPFGNADLVYTGSGDDFALNDGVKRYHADPRAAAYLSRWYTPTGQLTRPLLALHDSGDPLVVASTAFEYALITQRAGHADHFVQQYVNAHGHCVFTPAQIGKAFDELVSWKRDGKRPQSGRQR